MNCKAEYRCSKHVIMQPGSQSSPRSAKKSPVVLREQLVQQRVRPAEIRTQRRRWLTGEMWSEEVHVQVELRLIMASLIGE